jgi:hypothetical protein
MGPISCPETSVQNYTWTLRNIPEERRSYLLLGESLKSRDFVSCFIWLIRNACRILMGKPEWSERLEGLTIDGEKISQCIWRRMWGCVQESSGCGKGQWPALSKVTNVCVPYKMGNFFNIWGTTEPAPQGVCSMCLTSCSWEFRFLDFSENRKLLLFKKTKHNMEHGWRQWAKEETL